MGYLAEAGVGATQDDALLVAAFLDGGSVQDLPNESLSRLDCVSHPVAIGTVPAPKAWHWLLDSTLRRTEFWRR